MTLQIIDRGKNKLYSDGNFWELSRKEENNCFYGVSFVSSIKFITILSRCRANSRIIR
ncbi:hypothetical protein [Ligilactobacillus salivarius]|uniref:hypothetical protein n=1 Tax=Ligilactobacillus salivarius TaxID=1624 RepID=UPI00136953C3|nr:hypothetical protein [Ligilactobacillus salivarius]